LAVAQRLAASQARVLGLLGGSLAAQAARLLNDEASDGRVELPQRTLAAMLGVQRPSLNKVLKDLERDGLIRIGYAAIDILDPDRLARVRGREHDKPGSSPAGRAEPGAGGKCWP
jgi:CRP-like cAMP-binding protein